MIPVNFPARIGHEIELKESKEGKNFVNMTVYTRNPNKESDDSHIVTVFGKLAIISKEKLNKGQKVFISGDIQTSNWVDSKTGEKRFSSEIIAKQLDF